MSRDAALAYLHRWLGELNDPDPEQRAWKEAFAEGGLVAYERLGVLPPAEIERWRERLAAGGAGSPREFTDEPARAAAERYLEELLGRLTPLSRDPSAPDGLDADADFAAALEALYAAGVLDEARYASWSKRQLEVKAPWLDDPEPPPPGVATAIYVPPRDEQEAAEDAAAEAMRTVFPKRAHVRRVAVGTPERHEGLAIVALVAYDDAAELHFHVHLEPPPEGFEGFREAARALRAPVLRDDRGTGYEPLSDRPQAANGRGAIIHGHWLYLPAPPADVTGFTATAPSGEHTWRLG